MPVLLVSSEDDIAVAVRKALWSLGHEPVTVGSLDEAARVQEERCFSIVLIQVDSVDDGSLRRLYSGSNQARSAPVIAIARNRSIRNAVRCIRAGASDYLPAGPVDIRLLENGIRSALKAGKSPAADAERAVEEDGIGFITGDDRMLFLCSIVSSAVNTRTPLLIEGESGVGKSRMARMLHENSCRRFGPFVEIACRGVAERDLELELFGDGSDARIGKIEVADGGTIIINDITLISPATCARLSYFLRTGELARGAGARSSGPDVALVGTAGRAFSAESAEPRMLFPDWNALRIEIPPLRERVVDIPLLARHFLRRFSLLHRKAALELGEDALDRLVHYSWPGNARELSNAIEHGVLMAEEETLLERDLPARLAGESEALFSHQRRRGLRDALREPERSFILRALRNARGNKQHAASDLKISRSTLYKKMKELGLEEAGSYVG